MSSYYCQQLVKFIESRGGSVELSHELLSGFLGISVETTKKAIFEAQGLDLIQVQGGYRKTYKVKK